MTTLDKRIPYYPVLMVLTQPPVITDIPLAQGYSFHPYESSYKEAWIALHVSLGQLDSMEAGRRYFEETFEAQPKEPSGRDIISVSAVCGCTGLVLMNGIRERDLRSH